MAGLFGNLLAARESEQRAAWWEMVGIPSTNAGVSVTMDSALTMAAVFACIRILAEDVAKLPLHVYKRRRDGGKDRATDHPLYSILHDVPNDEMASFNWRESQQAWLGSWGNAYSSIRTNGRGEVVEIYPLRAEWMEPKRTQSGELVYEYRENGMGPAQTFPDFRILHIPGFGFDGIRGYSPIQLAKQSIGLGMAAEQYGARFFGNDARPGFVLSHPGKLGQEAYDRLKNELAKGGGLVNAHKPKILEEGLEIKEIGIPPEDAQFLQTRKFQVEEIARWYRMPPHKIQDLERSTNNNIEHQSIEYVVDTLMPWLSRWEQILTLKLLTNRERKQGYFIAFLVDALLRGDVQSRFAAYAQGRQWGWLSADDVRERENMNPLPDGQGKIYMVPLNMIPAGSVGSLEALAGDPGERAAESGEIATGPAGIRNEVSARIEQRAKQAANYRHKIMAAHRGIFADTAGRVVRAEAREIRKQATQMIGRGVAVAEFVAWLANYYEQHAEFTRDQFLPVLLSYAELVAEAVAQEGYQPDADTNTQRFMEVYAQSLGARHSGRNLYQLQAKIEQAQAGELDIMAAIDETLDRWIEIQPDEIALEESTRSNNALATMLYSMAGVMYLRWVSFGDSCPYCSNLDGRVIGIQEYFLVGGTEYQPEGAERPLTVNKSKRHPPAHGGCDCMVVAG